MNPVFSLRLKRWLLAGSFVPCFLVGCNAPDYTRMNKCANVTPGSEPNPVGSFVRQHQLVQQNKAEADDFVVYLHEWYMGREALGPYGEYHIAQMAQRLSHTPFPVLVEVSHDPALNEHRRRVVIEKLANCGATDAANRVVLGRPEAEGIYGVEGFRVYEGILSGGGNQNGGIGGGGGAGYGGGNGGGFLGGFPGY